MLNHPTLEKLQALRLTGMLSALSEQALHVAAKEAARSVMEEALHEEGMLSARSTGIPSDTPKALPEKGEE